MATCAARTGFLTLHDCGSPSTGVCSVCNRPMCGTHLSARSGYTQCLDCYARANAGAKDTGEYDSEWAYGYRRNYYSGYSPLYFGHSRDTYYDDYDVRSFDDDLNGGAVVDDDERDAGSFGDS